MYREYFDFIDSKQVDSGSFNNIYGQNGSFLTAGQQDYAERMSQIENQRGTTIENLALLRVYLP